MLPPLVALAAKKDREFRLRGKPRGRGRGESASFLGRISVLLPSRGMDVDFSMIHGIDVKG